MKTMVEISCGSAEDVIIAQQGNADRVELNCALYLGGLTPTLATLDYVKQHCTIPIISMVRSRAGGFCYNELEFDLMLKEAQELLEHGTDGLVFGALTAQKEIDVKRTKAMVDLAHSYGKELVIHRAFDCVNDPYKSIEELIELKVDRVLTSGNRNTAMEGKTILKTLQERYGTQIEIMMAGRITHHNAVELMKDTGITQIHSSCKTWVIDPASHNEYVSYAYGDKPSHYDCVDPDLVKRLVDSIR